MPIKNIACGLALALVAAGAAAQTMKDNEKALRDSLVKKRFLLRGFNASPEIRWRWNGSALVQEPSKFHTLGVLVPKSVSVKGDTVRIAGERHTLLRSGDTGFMLSEDTASVQVVVDLKAADMATLMPKLPDLLFYPDLKTALADLPEEYRGLLPADSDFTGTKDKFKNCDCAELDTSQCGQERPDIGMAGIKPPRLLNQVDPELPDSTRTGTVDANVQVGLIIDTAGKPDFLWVSKSGASEVVASAVRAVSQYRFAPATCHDHPVPVTLLVDVNFHID